MCLKFKIIGIAIALTNEYGIMEINANWLAPAKISADARIISILLNPNVNADTPKVIEPECIQLLLKSLQ